MGVVTKNVPRPLRARTLHLKILDPPLRSTTESRLMESGSFTGATEPEKSEGAKALPGHCHEDGANPDMVAVSLRCSCKLGCVQDSHLQALLVSLYEGMNSFQWTLGADFQDTTSFPTAGDTGHKYFCSTYPLRGSTKWPWGVSEQTDTVLVNIWIQSTGTNKKPHDVMEHVSDTVGQWVSGTLNSSDKIWIMCRYSTPLGATGSLEKVAGKGYQDGKSIS